MYILCAAGRSRLPAPSSAPSATHPAAVLRTPLVERRRADAQHSAQLRHRQSGFHPFDRLDDLAVRESRLLHAVELLNEKTLLLTSPVLRGNYQKNNMPSLSSLLLLSGNLVLLKGCLDIFRLGEKFLILMDKNPIRSRELPEP